MNKNLNMLKKQAMETGTETFMEMAMERMQEEKSTAEEWSDRLSTIKIIKRAPEMISLFWR